MAGSRVISAARGEKSDSSFDTLENSLIYVNFKCSSLDLVQFLKCNLDECSGIWARFILNRISELVLHCSTK